MTLLGNRQVDENGPRWVYLSGEPTIPGHQYRVVRPIAAATRLGIQAAWMGMDELLERAEELSSVAAVVVWRVPWDDRLATAIETARGRGAKIIFDLDDLMIAPELARPEVIDGIRSQNFSADLVRDYYARMRQTMFAADLCVASTAELAGFMRLASMPTIVVPNGFDHSVLAVSRLAGRHRSAMPGDGLVRIGYATGTRTHQRDFSVCVGAVAEVLRQHPECRLVLFQSGGHTQSLIDTNEFPDLRGLESQIEWRQAVPLAELPLETARFDINLAPLEVGNPFCESKSELKYFEAALVDVPTVASPTGPFRRAIRHGETGYLASTQDEWCDILTELVADAQKRRRIAGAARRDVWWTFGPERRREMLKEVCDIVVGGSLAARSFQCHVRPAPARPQLQVPQHEVLFNIDHLGRAKITVVIPLYNYAKFICEALASVAAQTLPDLDLIVVDDHSTDESLSLVLEWAKTNAERFNRISILRNRTNSGLGATRNVGFDASDTPFILALDADNRLLPGCAAACLAAIETTDAAFAYPVIRVFGALEDLMGTLPFDPVRLAQGNYIDAMALVSKAAWSCVGGYDHIRTGWEDFDLWCSFAERGWWGVQVSNEPLAEKRAHAESMLQTFLPDPEKLRLMVSRLVERHAWLDEQSVASTAIQGALRLRPASVADERTIVSAISGRSADRLSRLLPILRCPESGTALAFAADGDALLSEGGVRRWPLVNGRPLLFPGMSDPAIHPDSHLSNEIPDSALQLIHRTDGLVLHLSAGGTPRQFENVVELEAAVFRHTDIIGDVHRLPFVDGAFSAVISLNAFEHYRDPHQAVREIYRVLQPGGRLLVHTAFLQPLHEAPWHFYNCTRYGLENWFRDFETEVLHVSDNFHVGFSLSWLASECEAALHGSVSPAAARAFGATPIDRLIAMWRDPQQRDGDLMWENLRLIPQEAQEAMAAGFEYLGRRPG
jgi:SAM-dependent methyltransferase/glycosyltransferase involved in cell wall biosynthesis